MQQPGHQYVDIDMFACNVLGTGMGWRRIEKPWRYISLRSMNASSRYIARDNRPLAGEYARLYSLFCSMKAQKSGDF